MLFQGNWYRIMFSGGIIENVVMVLVNTEVLDGILKEVYKVQFCKVETSVITCFDSLIQVLEDGRGYMDEFYTLE